MTKHGVDCTGYDCGLCRALSTGNDGMAPSKAYVLWMAENAENHAIVKKTARQLLQDNLTGMKDEQADWESDE